jgi:glycosyltransferase involved in cell wall biosynthesis
LGHEVIWATDSSPDMAQELAAEGFRHHVLPLRVTRSSPVLAFRGILALARVVRSEAINCIHSRHRWTNLLGGLGGPLIRRPLITTYNGIHDGFRRFSFWGEKVICVSEDCRRHLVDYFGVSPDKAVVILNGVDTDRWNPALRRGGWNGGVPPGRRPVLVSVGQLRDVKDPKTMIRALPLVRSRFEGATLKCAGDGPLRSELIRLADELGVGGSVELLGEVSDTRSVLAEADVFLMPSRSEGLPNALLEAMAAGVPAVVTEVGGMAEIVQHRKNGCKVPVGNHVRLAEEICFLLSNPAAAEAIGREARSLIERDFSLERMARQVEAVYREVLASFASKRL